MIETRNNSTMQGFVTAIYEIGCLAGALFILAMGDVLGRRRAMIIGGVIMIIGAIIQVTAYKDHSALAQFIIGRVITGVGNGINTSTIPTYQGELSKTAFVAMVANSLPANERHGTGAGAGNRLANTTLSSQPSAAKRPTAAS